MDNVVATAFLIDKFVMKTLNGNSYGIPQNKRIGVKDQLGPCVDNAALSRVSSYQVVTAVVIGASFERRGSQIEVIGPDPT